MAKILVVDDEIDLLELVKYNMEVAGYEVDTAATGNGGLEKVGEFGPDLVVLDVMLPDLTGFEVLRTLRQSALTRDIPVIMLTARGEEADVLGGFELGADDYMTKPFSPRELVARVRAVLARGAGVETKPKTLNFDELEINRDSHQVFVDGREIPLAPQEYKLLVFLAMHPRQAFSRESLLAHAWGPDVYLELRTVDVHVRRLRAHLNKQPTAPKFIETVRGAGYRFNPNPNSDPESVKK